MQISSTDIRRARKRLLQMHYESHAGHLGGNLSALDAMMVLHHEIMGPDDRFVLSKGHSAGALYVTLWSLGRLDDADLTTFHRDDTSLAGHPPPKGIDGVMFGTGSLGHGVSLAAGLALAAGFQGTARRVYCLTSDGEWEEGSNWEALIFAVHHHLSRLMILVDANGLQGFGKTADIASLEPLTDKFSALNLAVNEVDGHDLMALRGALTAAVDRPTVIIMRTHKGQGISFMQDRLEWHYLPMNDDQYHRALTELEQS